MIQTVTTENLDAVLKTYITARGGERNNNTDSEAMFVLSTKFELGAMLLTAGFSILWIGMQNATSRMSSDGNGTPYKTTREAVLHALSLCPTDIYYTDNAIERFRWLADRLEAFYKDNSVRLTLSVSRSRKED